ncbi:uncharacterized protein HMPREF1541_03951 [Cyphellophora europaea CBS 101466]|uniref:Zn(2)-C6 fungal-type domain-containing protein n=1 Tax=Cyphellophora europaea (strain CBS 101466) TaxID=1220924 RepID=W2S004_CYPE1|nr:uncharacterized protein HMPREF1541_03951 [Cyphellophora europaea CBS 101466]ETN42012.1 hypothetical protein HMPREF1541_03951 [Cyphellophora europaea CBS 101466]
MQYSQHPNFPPLLPSFKRHRSSIDQARFKVDLTLPVLPEAPVWASLPTPPMSGSPPSERPSPPQIAGQRRKRSDSLPLATAGASSLPNPPPHGPSIYGFASSSEQSTYPAPYTTTYVPPQSMAYASGPIAAPASSPTDPRLPSGQLSPRTSRKNKAHVASACINCKKKHLRCDNARPCRRCVQAGKEDTCQDVVHKKRGRPPLRPEDPSSRRSFDAGLLTDPARRMPTTDPASYAQAGQYSRSFRPLQAQPSYDASRSQFRPGQPYGLYAAPSVGPSSATAMGQFVPSRGYGQGPHMPPQPPSPYVQPSGPSRPIAPYPQTQAYGYGPPDSMRPPTTQIYSAPLFPRNQLPPPHNDPVPSGAGPSSLQLPPIRPIEQRSSIDPALTQQGHAYPQHNAPRDPREGTGTTRQPDSKRPKMDIQGILGPKHD